MRRLIVIGLSLIGFSTYAAAQETALPRGMGYFFVAPGFVATSGEQTGTLQIGGGGECRIFKGLAVGAELGGLGPLGTATWASTSGMGVFSLNGYYHFANATPGGKMIPFITAGYTGVGSTEWAERWFNVGGGADYWVKNRVGLRVEFRDQVDANHSEPIHFAGVRVGLVWH
ncbi:MAG: hypothetical protein HY316_06950 [Acidobacteria bacterium]|nr:hypothetical protein [Acidobacteriota bacterium]